MDFTQIILIHKNVKNMTLFSQCVNQSTKVFFYDPSNKNLIDDINLFVANNQSIARFGFVWDNPGYVTIPFFQTLDNNKMIIMNSPFISKGIVDFIKNIIQINTNILKIIVKKFCRYK